MKASADSFTDLDMSKGLSIEHQTFASLHWVIHVEVAHAHDIFVDIELTEIPDHCPQSLYGSLHSEHIPNGFGNAGREDVVGHVVIFARRVHLLQFLQGSLIIEAFNIPQSCPQTPRRQDHLEKSCGRNGKRSLLWTSQTKKPVDVINQPW